MGPAQFKPMFKGRYLDLELSMGLCLTVMWNSKYSWYQDKLVILALSLKDWVELHALPLSLHSHMQQKCCGGNSCVSMSGKSLRNPRAARFSVMKTAPQHITFMFMKPG